MQKTIKNTEQNGEQNISECPGITLGVSNTFDILKSPFVENMVNSDALFEYAKLGPLLYD